MGEALLGGALAGVVFFGIRWLRGFSQRMNEHPADDLAEGLDTDPEGP